MRKRVFPGYFSKTGFVLFFISCISLSFLRPLDPHRRITQYNQRLWTTADGLPQNTVMSILQTSDGYLWLGTLEGLARFNGVTFTVFKKDTSPEIKSEYIYTLYEDRENNLWFGTREGLTRYKNGTFKTFTTANGLWDNNVLSVYNDTSGKFWVGTSKGLNRLRDGNIEKIHRFAGMRVKTIYEDRSHVTWFGTDHGLAQWENDTFTFFTTADGLAVDVVQTLVEDDRGNLWIASYGGGLNRFSRAERKFTVITRAEGLSSNNLTGLCLDKDNNLWVGTEGSGVNRITMTGSEIDTIGWLNSKNGLSNDYIGGMYEDREGSLWIGTEKGVSQLKNGKLMTWTTAEGLSDDYISCVYEDSQKRLWIGTFTAGLNIMENNRVPAFSGMNVKGKMPLKIASVLEDRTHTLWIGTRGDGLARLKDTRITTFTINDGLSHNTVWAIHEDDGGNLWIGTKKGLNKFAQGKFRVFGSKEGLNNENIYAITSETRGNLWIGTSGGGLNLFKNGNFTAYTTAQGLSDNIILCIYKDPDQEGRLWIGTSYGLNRFDFKKEKAIVTTYTTRNGLFDNVVFQVLEDSKGYLWMSSNRGIYKVKKELLNRFARGEVAAIHSQGYGTAEGMRSVECNGGFQPAGWKRHDGALFFPTTEGLAMIVPGKDEGVFNPVPPPVYVELLVVNGKRNPFRSGGALGLGPGVDKVEFHYTALSFISPRDVKFKFKLEGYDREWEYVEKPRDRIAYYGHLPPGDYTFRVTACNNDGVWNDTGTAVRVRILPFFWQTWWFRFLALLGFAVVSYFIISQVKKYINIFNFWKQKNYIGNYRLIDTIGSGGMGTVYLAVHTAEPARKVALKVLKEEYGTDDIQVRRFKREAVVIDQIEHPNIVRIIERGEHGQRLYIAMEWLSGKTLAERLTEDERLSIRDCLHIMEQVAGALAAIHRKNIIHRDLKPDNIMLVRQGNDPLYVKLLDFGLAKAGTFSKLTETGMVIGTLSYIAPEQITESAYSSASDIYSLGVTFYEMVTGIKPFFGETSLEIMKEILNKDPAEPMRLREETPRDLSRLVMRMIAKKPGDRPLLPAVCDILEHIRSSNI